MARVRVYNKQTGQWGTVSEQFANSPKFSMTGPEPAQQSSGILSSLVSPFKNTLQRVFGAGQEIGLNRMGKVDDAEELMKEAQRRMMAGDNSPEVLKMLSTAERLSKTGAKDTVASKNQETLTDPLQMAKDSAAILSWGVPGPNKVGTIAPKATDVFTKSLGRSLLTQGGLGGFGYSQKEDAEGLIGDTLKGAGTSWAVGQVLNKLLSGKAGKVSKADDQISKKDLKALRKQMKMVSGDIKTSDPKWLEKSIQRQKYLQTATTAGSDDMAKALQLTNELSEKASKANALLDSSANAVDVVDLKTFIKSYVKDKVPSNLLDESLVDNYIDDIIRKTPDGKVTGKIINETKKSLEQVSQAYGKASAGTSQNVASQATVKELERALKKSLDVLEPEASKILSDMAPIYDVLPALQKSAKSSVRVPIAGDVTVAKPAIQSISDRAVRSTRPLPGATQATQATKGATPFLESLFGSKVPTIAAGASVSGTTPEPTQLPTPTQESGGFLGLSKEDLQLISLLPEKDQAALMTKLITEQVTGGGGGNLQEISNAAARAYQTLSQGSVSTGMIGGRAEKVKSQLGLGGDQETLDFNVAIQNIYSAIAKLRGGTALTAEEKKLLGEYLPKSGDSKQMLETKLRYIMEHPEVVVLK